MGAVENATKALRAALASGADEQEIEKLEAAVTTAERQVRRAEMLTEIAAEQDVARREAKRLDEQKRSAAAVKRAVASSPRFQLTYANLSVVFRFTEADATATGLVAEAAKMAAHVLTNAHRDRVQAARGGKVPAVDVRRLADQIKDGAHLVASRYRGALTITTAETKRPVRRKRK